MTKWAIFFSRKPIKLSNKKLNSSGVVLCALSKFGLYVCLYVSDLSPSSQLGESISPRHRVSPVVCPVPSLQLHLLLLHHFYYYYCCYLYYLYYYITTSLLLLLVLRLGLHHLENLDHTEADVAGQDNNTEIPQLS